MWLPRWIKKIVFGPQPTPKQCLNYVTRGGLRAIQTRTTIYPNLLIFGLCTDDQVMFQATIRPDLDPEIASRLVKHMSKTAEKFFDDEAVEVNRT